jgi:hypothetical protein
MKPIKNTKILSVGLTPNLYNSVHKYSEATGLSVVAIIRTALYEKFGSGPNEKTNK